MLEMAARRARKDGGEDMAKYIFVTGGVVSGLGKGITAAALGRLLKARGLTVAAQKLDPYINVDPGTMSPYQHGEVFVTEDGAETDLDLGHYERFIDEDLNQFSNLTTGKVYWNVLQKERAGRYLGETVQVIPHITGEIQAYIAAVADKTAADVVITEIGGTTGDIESQPFLEAIRQFARARHGECVFIHVTLVPYLASSGEHKSKPTQHSVRELQSFGISPDIIVARCDEPLEDAIRQKIALFCNVEADCVIENETLPVLYEVPMMLEKRRLAEIVCQKLGLSPGPCDLRGWEAMLERIRTAKKPVEIALVGKYVKLHDAYLSVAEALRHGGYENGAEVNIRWIDSERVEEAAATTHDDLDVVKGVDIDLLYILHIDPLFEERVAGHVLEQLVGQCTGVHAFHGVFPLGEVLGDKLLQQLRRFFGTAIIGDGRGVVGGAVPLNILQNLFIGDALLAGRGKEQVIQTVHLDGSPPKLC